jgi:hypothetical protein
MMKRICLASACIFTLLFASCGPAAENREQMHARARVFQDSIANMIRSTMAEAEAPGPFVAVPAPAPSATPEAK